MLYCLNIDCLGSENPDGTNFCQSCGTNLVPLLRGRYQIIQSLGGGGFGRTYLALDQDKLKEKCVVKQFAPQVQGSWALQKATELFEQEAHRLQQLGEHPQIPTLYGYFEENKHLYLVQQFVEGQNLWEELNRQGGFSEQKIWAVLSDLLPILQFVHEQQVIHRDIKPANIIRRAHDGKLVLIDFGVSKHGSAVTTAKRGTTIGSHGYAPLEQMQGGEAYPASDLYSLGATCFHLLTNIDPYSLWQRQGYGWVESWQQHLSHPISAELQAVLSKLLEIEQQQRYQSAALVLHDLAQPLMPIALTVSSSQGHTSLPLRSTTTAIASPILSSASSAPTMQIATATSTLLPRRRSFSPLVGIFLLLIMASSALLVYLFKGGDRSVNTSIESVPSPSITTSPDIKPNDSGKSKVDKIGQNSTSNPNSQQQQESPKPVEESSQGSKQSATNQTQPQLSESNRTQLQSSESNPIQTQSSESNRTQRQSSESNPTQPQSSETLPLVKEPSSSISSKPISQERRVTQTNERRVTQKLSEPSSTRSQASDSEPLWGSSSSPNRSKPRSPASDSEPLWGSSSSSSSQRSKSQAPKSSPLW